jgi:hypothetical protein
MPEKMTVEEFEEQRAQRREEEEKTQREAYEAKEKESAKQDWIAVGGTAETFEREYPEIRSERLRAEVRDRQQAARAESRRRTHLTF